MRTKERFLEFSLLQVQPHRETFILGSFDLETKGSITFISSIGKDQPAWFIIDPMGAAMPSWNCGVHSQNGRR